MSESKIAMVIGASQGVGLAVSVAFDQSWGVSYWIPCLNLHTCWCRARLSRYDELMQSASHLQMCKKLIAEGFTVYGTVRTPCVEAEKAGVTLIQGQPHHLH